MNVEKIENILNKLNDCIENDIPFSLIRFGDGGIKLLHAFFRNEKSQMKAIVRREGLPKTKIKDIIKAWGYFSRNADYIDTPEVYFTDQFWPRLRKPKTMMTLKTETKMKKWEKLYKAAHMINENYCNPESNYLMILDDRRNIVDLMKKRKTAIIAAVSPYLQLKLRSQEYDTTVIPIAGHHENQYCNSFNSTLDIIKHTAKDYDFWMVAAGELGRIYTGYIKECGGRAVDVGYVVDLWSGDEVHVRLKQYLQRSDKSDMLLSLTDEGKWYARYI